MLDQSVRDPLFWLCFCD